MNPRDLIKTARELTVSGNNKPRQANLLRATSTAYYALFHTLAKCCADLLIGGSGSQRSPEAWRQVYRALEHGVAKNACDSKLITKFPNEIQDFANAFITMQAKRHKADYDPTEKTYKSLVSLDIDMSENVIDGFHQASLKDRRAFAAFVLFRPPRKETKP